jgi:hypothetical protein
VTTQIEDIMTAFQSSFKKTNGYLSVGFSIVYLDYSISVEVMQSLVENANNAVEYLGAKHETKVNNHYVSFGLTYKLG